jgi:gliding motility-associated-like protein
LKLPANQLILCSKKQRFRIIEITLQPVMFIKRLLLLLIINFFTVHGIAQTACTTLGQNPGTAFPVCGTSVFSQSTVPVCGGNIIPCPSCLDPFSDKNPFWYKFTCFTGGTLGFVITPNAQLEDYDWQLFDITNHNPEDVYTDTSLFVACDWSGELGPTGTSAAGNGLVNCDNFVPLFSSMPTLIQGHNYILLVSHFSNSQSGYSLSFAGGSAVITDTTQARLVNAYTSCDNFQVYVSLNKKMQCSSLAADGSDFIIQNGSGALFPPASASSLQCSNGFDMDSIILTMPAGLAPGNYTVTVKTGSDGNSLLDNCENDMPTESISLNVPIPKLPVMDSLTTVGCAPNVLQLYFKTGILCNSIAPDGSDFMVTGTSPVSVTGATGNCYNGSANIIQVQLGAPIQQQGVYQIKLVNGSDGNTLIDECEQAIPAGSALAFNTKDTVSALFSYQLQLGCKIDTIDYLYTEKDEVNTWQWSFDNNITSTLQNPSIPYSSYGQEYASLIASNGVCSDTASATILLGNELKASFEGSNLACPGDLATFKETSIGNIISWNWDFGNGNASTLQVPPAQSYFTTATETEVPVTLMVQNDIGCFDSATQYIKVVDNCYIAVPSAFTPNGDGLNDYLYPLNAYKAVNLTFKVFNRYGQLIFETSDWTNKWDGTFQGQPANTGTYVWILQYTDSDTGKKYFSKGSTVLIR